ncbi:ATPase [Arthrobacter phage KellEzio]|uniref:AAA-ATPase n=1 Tax=Arthrobacter phage KellEzio TaxID=1796995 RepID=A0A140G6G3_9CAUD|nr:ATPase [Arthrobacter phage KellEzio]AMM44248.1 AAA-ATPase [Arthrobacter phage KellEzio]
MATRKSEPGEGQDSLFKPSCPNGVELNMAVSILIKELRRGKELEALYWAKQIESRYHKYVWRRLAIFAAEDVGLSNANLIVQINALWETYNKVMADSSSKAKPDGNILTMAVYLCAISPKNREVDNLKNVLGALEKEANWAPEIPDYAVDGHTAAGRAANPELNTDRGRALHWFTIGSHVENQIGPRDAELWHFRNLARREVMPAEEVEKIAQEWNAAGKLLFGTAGKYPVVPADAPKD